MKATIDRFEDGWAVLLLREDESVEFELPACMLPCGCREGDILDIVISRDVEATREATERVSGLIEKLKKKNKSSSIIKSPGKDEMPEQ
ncbi:hypothetical protein MCP_2128 [Methanocella paludicola SANAE]|uniref:DUF3006 domain-containing protein n=1 Tax=Methanocella paludicola (strain DSM 17711 / JCM 13418 / NBRC 101707 / SANAE) TaxID=304371 RepID=D1Z0H8_METPS|nr:DUF3006 domain-containing protein [Methanocella paludicola]BAI62200.1 hypothetical protein MCP_2128 [Methanocella paludicola SANAE]